MYTLMWRVPGVHVYGAKADIEVPVGSTVSNKASIRFTGKGAANTGKIQQENLMRLTENFAGPTPPAYATTGQTWYDTLSNQLKVCVSCAPQPEVWVAAGGGIQTTGPNDPPPEDPKPGDLWMQTTGSGSSVLYVFSGTGRYPETAAGIGGWDQISPQVERHAGREEFESMMALVEQLIGPASTRGSGAAGRSVTTLADIGKLDRSMRAAWTARTPNDTNTLLAIANEPYIPFQASSRNRLAIKTNYSNFSTRDYNELYVCGFNLTSIAMEDIDGEIYIDNTLIPVARGACYTSNIFSDGLIIWDTTSTLTSAVGPAHFFVARKNGSVWQYDQGAVVGTWTNFTPQSGMFAIGIATTVALDTGTPGTPPGVVSATAWDNAVELTNSSIAALKIEPNSNDWDQLLAASKYALNRLDFPASVIDDISPLPFVNDGKAPVASLMGLSPSDPRFPSQERRSGRRLGAVTMNRMFTETANVLNSAIGSRYILGGMLGTSGTRTTFGPSITVDLQASVQANAGASGGVFGQATRTTGIVMRFNNRDELERFFYAGQALQLRVTHAPGTNTAADLNLKGLTDGYGLIRLLADRSLTMVSTGTPALNAPITNVGGVELGASPTVISSSTNGTSTLQVTAKALSDTSIQLDLFVLAGGVTSGTFTAEWSVVNDNETWAGGRVYPGVLPYASGTDFVAGNFTDSTPINPLAIQTQPQSTAVNTGNVATFGVVVTGSGPIAYQWRKNGVDIVGANSSSYSFSVTNGDNGAVFNVYVSNPYSNVTSSNATLTVTNVTAPTMTLANTTALAGSAQTLIGSYTGSSITWSATRNGNAVTVNGSGSPVIASGGNVYLDPSVLLLPNNGDVYVITATNPGGSVNRTMQLTVNPRSFTLTQNSLSLTQGSTTSARLAAEQGSDAAIGNTVISTGALPAGVTLSGTAGYLTGAPTSSGSYSFSATFTPVPNQTNVVSRTFSYSGSVVAPSYLSGGFTDLGTALTGQALSTVVAGAQPYNPGVNVITGINNVTGTLPPGTSLYLPPGGYEYAYIQGTPTTTGNYAFAFDAYHTTGSPNPTNVPHTVTVVNHTFTTTDWSFTFGQSIPSFTGGRKTIASSNVGIRNAIVSSGSLPPGVSISVNQGGNGDVIVGGTPTAVGTYTFQITSQTNDSLTPNATFTTGNITITILSDGSGINANGTLGTFARAGFSGAVLAIATPNTKSIYSPTVIAGALPPGTNLYFSAPNYDLRLGGSPTTAGTYSFTLQFSHDTAATNPYVQNYTITFT